ncbi:pyruvate, phosphate dikinase 2-like [Physcomitrium patens]|uniref:pyruvate, phosphate dikinase 2-like n=1 Tax=Physcomitrium patens TaxID=3218 RepID=UPI003CCE436E
MRMPGEDVVAGIRTPEDIDTVKYVPLHTYKELRENCDILEAHYKEMMIAQSSPFSASCVRSDSPLQYHS